MNKPKKVTFWANLDMSKRGNLLFLGKKVAYS